MLFHHNRPLEHCLPGIVQPNPSHLLIDNGGDVEDNFYQAYKWLEGQIGHWPLFLSVGDHPEAWYMTGYASQWEKILTLRYQDGKRIATHRKAGEFPSLVMFSYKDTPPQASFSSYHWWHCALNGPASQEEEKEILRPAYSAQDWLKKSKRSPGSVQAHVPQLDLSAAERIWCRSQKAKKQLMDRGFDREKIQVKRLSVQSFASW